MTETLGSLDISTKLERIAKQAKEIRDAPLLTLAVLFDRKSDALQFLRDLHVRFVQFGLALHPEKTRLVPFRRPDLVDNDRPGPPGTFNLFGFTHCSSSGFGIARSHVDRSDGFRGKRCNVSSRGFRCRRHASFTSTTRSKPCLSEEPDAGNRQRAGATRPRARARKS